MANLLLLHNNNNNKKDFQIANFGLEKSWLQTAIGLFWFHISIFGEIKGPATK